MLPPLAPAGCVSQTPDQWTSQFRFEWPEKDNLEVKAGKRRTFPIKVQVDALLVRVGDGRRLVRALEPRQVLLVEPPTLLLQLVRGEVLQVRPRAVVKDVEQRVDVELGEQGRRGELRGRFLRVVRRRRVRVPRDVVVRPATKRVILSESIHQNHGHDGDSLLGVERLRDVDEAGLEHLVDRVEVLLTSQGYISSHHNKNISRVSDLTRSRSKGRLTLLLCALKACDQVGQTTRQPRVRLGIRLLLLLLLLLRTFLLRRRRGLRLLRRIGC